MEKTRIDALDTKIIKALVVNARRPFIEIARECGISSPAIHYRIRRLIDTGVIYGYETLVNPAAVGYETCAYMGFFLKDPSRFDQVVEELKKIPEVIECHFTTGQYDMLIKLYARDNGHLLQIIQNKLQPLGLSRTESLISFKEAFKRQFPIAGLLD